MNFVDHTFSLSTQADADGAIAIPLDTELNPATLESVAYVLTAVAGSPTGVTLDVNLTDGTTSKVAINGQSIGTAVGSGVLRPTEADQEEGNHYISQIAAGAAVWRALVDFNFTGGTSPTVTGQVTLRFRV